MLNLKVLGSSSSGNCYLIRTSSEVLIIECGVHYKKILQALDFNLNNVAGILITHEHQDHCSAAMDLLKAGINIYSAVETFERLNIKHHRAKCVENQKTFSVGGFTILPFDVEHDVANPFGFLIYHPEIGKIIFATDTYFIRYTFKDINHYMLECNYSKEILDKNVEEGRLHPQLKRRLLRSHFSLENVKEFLRANDLSKTESIYLMHLSANNSDSKLFKTEIEKLTGIPVEVC